MTTVTIDLLFERLASRGEGAYGLSDVSQLDHALQSAALASARGLGDQRVIAALFHDVGHLVSDADTDLAAQGIDDRHEEASADVLAPLFGLPVSGPACTSPPSVICAARILPISISSRWIRDAVSRCRAAR